MPHALRGVLQPKQLLCSAGGWQQERLVKLMYALTPEPEKQLHLSLRLQHVVPVSGGQHMRLVVDEAGCTHAAATGLLTLLLDCCCLPAAAHLGGSAGCRVGGHTWAHMRIA